MAFLAASNKAGRVSNFRLNDISCRRFGADSFFYGEKMSLYYQEHTQAGVDISFSPLVILHGMFGSGDNWLTIARQFGQERPVFTIDLPGHGKSYTANAEQARSGIFDYRDMARQVAGTLSAIAKAKDYLSGQQWILLGHSMGGKTAMALALLFPKLIRAVLIIDSAPIDYRSRDYNKNVLEMLMTVDPANFQSRMDADHAMQRWIVDPLLRGFLIKSLQKYETGGFRWCFDVQAIRTEGEAIADWPFTPDVSYFGPAFFLAGELSDYVQPGIDDQIIRSYFPESTIEIVESARHWIHADNKVAFMQQTSRFLLKIN